MGINTPNGIHDEIGRELHKRARNIADDLSKNLLTISTAIIAAFFILIFSKDISLMYVEKILLFISIDLFGLSILSNILGMQWDASRNYYLGKINDLDEMPSREKNIIKKTKLDKKQLVAKMYVRIFFLLGILLSISFLSIRLFY